MDLHGTILFRPLKTLAICGDKILGVYGDAVIPPFATRVESGKHDYTICEGCQAAYKGLLNTALKKLEDFPLCCELHANLVKVQGFDKSMFKEAPEQLASKVVYTFQHIVNNIDRQDWYTDICDYLDYTFFSFGAFPEKCGEPLFRSMYEKEVLGFLERGKNSFGEMKAQKLLDFLHDYFLPETTKENELELLFDYYKKWFSEFPFDISIFSGLKEKYEKTIPILREEPHYNPYLKMTRGRLHTKDSLIDTLLKLTENLLVNINTLTFYQNGLLNDAQKTKMEMGIAKRKIQLKDGYIKKGKSPEQAYRKILKQWYQDEIEFLDTIKDVIKPKPGRPKLENLPEKLEDIFVNPDYCEPCLNILKHLDPPVIDAENRYIGNLKGVIPLWIKTLKNFKGKSIIKNYPDHVYTKVINKAISGINLTKDASEFRKGYTRLNRTDYEVDIKTFLSQLSQMGKLGK